MAEEAQTTESSTEQQTTPAVTSVDGQQDATPGANPTPPAEIMGKDPTETPVVPPTEIMGKVPEAVPQDKTPPPEVIKAADVPDSYTAFQNAPEGFVMDQETSQLFQKAGLSQDGAQALVDGLRERQNSDNVLRQQQLTNQHNENITMLKQDVEFGGMHYDQTLKNSSLGLNRINALLKDDSLTKVLTDNNIQTHPSVVKLFSMIETWHGEKGFITSETNSNIYADKTDPLSILGQTQANEIMKAREAMKTV